jgi:hypothetical protein
MLGQASQNCEGVILRHDLEGAVVSCEQEAVCVGTAILLILGAGLLALVASVVMSRASNRSALWNMGFAAVLLVALIGLLLAIAFILTESTMRS